MFTTLKKQDEISFEWVMEVSAAPDCFYSSVLTTAPWRAKAELKVKYGHELAVHFFFFFLAESNIFLCGWHPGLTPVTSFFFLFDNLTFTVQCLCRIAQTVKFRFIRLALISQGLPQRMDPYCLIWHRFKGRWPSWRNPSFYLCLRHRCRTICVSSWFRIAEFSRVKRMR